MNKINLIALIFCALSAPTFANTFEVVSPDGVQKAIVQTYENDEATVTVVNVADPSNKALATINLISEDHSHGHAIDKYKWSNDSKFFAFNTKSSGGHSPWHFISFFYSRASETFRNIDIRANVSVASEEFTLGDNGAFTATLLPEGEEIENAAESNLNLNALDKIPTK